MAIIEEVVHPPVLQDSPVDSRTHLTTVRCPHCQELFQVWVNPQEYIDSSASLGQCTGCKTPVFADVRFVPNKLKYHKAS